MTVWPRAAATAVPVGSPTLSGLAHAWPTRRRGHRAAIGGAAPADPLTPAQHASPLAARRYDLRHAGVSLALNAGVPATEVARRAGHSVAVLLKIYAHCIDGQADAANKRIADALGSEDDEDGQDERD